MPRLSLGTDLSAVDGQTIYLAYVLLSRTAFVVRIDLSLVQNDDSGDPGPEFSDQMEMSGSITFESSAGQSVTVTDITDATEPYEWNPPNLTDVRAFTNHVAGLTDRSLTVTFNDNP